MYSEDKPLSYFKEEAELLMSKIRYLERAYKKSPDWKAKAIRVQLYNFMQLGGYKILGYKSWTDLCAKEFTEDYALEVECALIEEAIGLKIGTYSVEQLRILRAIGLTEPRKLIKFWQSCQQYAASVGVDFPQSRKKNKDLELMTKVAQDKSIQFVDDKVARLKLKIKQLQEHLKSSVDYRTVDLSLLSEAAQVEFERLMKQHSVGVAVRYAEVQIKYLEEIKKPCLTTLSKK